MRKSIKFAIPRRPESNLSETQQIGSKNWKWRFINIWGDLFFNFFKLNKKTAKKLACARTEVGLCLWRPPRGGNLLVKLCFIHGLLPSVCRRIWTVDRGRSSISWTARNKGRSWVSYTWITQLPLAWKKRHAPCKSKNANQIQFLTQKSKYLI